MTKVQLLSREDALFHTASFPSKHLLVFSGESAPPGRQRVKFINYATGELWVEPYRGRARRVHWRKA